MELEGKWGEVWKELGAGSGGRVDQHTSYSNAKFPNAKNLKIHLF